MGNAGWSYHPARPPAPAPMNAQRHVLRPRPQSRNVQALGTADNPPLYHPGLAYTPALTCTFTSPSEPAAILTAKVGVTLSATRNPGAAGMTRFFVNPMEAR